MVQKSSLLQYILTKKGTTNACQEDAWVYIGLYPNKTIPGVSPKETGGMH